jgi:hypothetical protein
VASGPATILRLTHPQSVIAQERSKGFVSALLIGKDPVDVAEVEELVLSPK